MVQAATTVGGAGVGQSEPAAQANRQLLSDAGVFAVHLSGNPGCGKTTLLEATLKRLMLRAQVGAIVAHLAAGRDGAALQRAGARSMVLEVAQLDAATLHGALDSILFSQSRLDLLVIENAGQSSDCAEPDLGQDARVAVFSATGGDDKAAEFPQRVRGADLVLLTKTDLLPHVKFDLEVFEKDVRRMNRRAAILKLSARDGSGMDDWVDWLLGEALKTRTSRSARIPSEASEWWFG